jgi:hypothetical protein
MGGGHVGSGGTGGIAGMAGIGGMSGSGGIPDAPMIDASIDARTIDAPMIDARIDGPTVDAGAPMSCNPTLDGTSTPNGCANDPGGPKCAATFPDPLTGPVLQCEPAGTVAAGGSCVRTVDSSGNEIAGVDNCINGYCSGFDATNGRICAPYCDAATRATNCTSTQDCFLQATGGNGNLYGLCRRTCDPFGAQSQCPQNNTGAPGATAQVCSWSVLENRSGIGAFCSIFGGTVSVEGGVCNPNTTPTPTDCAAGLICLGDNTCHKLCDATHACAAGQMCSPATFATTDTCDASGNGCPAPEQCDAASLSCILVVTNANQGGWCLPMPDGGGLIRALRRENARPLPKQ